MTLASLARPEHRGRKSDPLYGIRTILRCGQKKLTERNARLAKAIVADEGHDEVVYVAWQCAQQLRSGYKAKSPVEGRRIAENSSPRCRRVRSRRSSNSAGR